MPGPRVKRGPTDLEIAGDAVNSAGGSAMPDREDGPAGGAGDGRRADGSGALDAAAEERELLEAIERYRRTSKRMFPTWSEVLEIMQQLGYRKPD